MSLPSVSWSCAPYSVSAAARLEAELGLSSTAASILVRRGHASPGEARCFLAAEERHDPFAFAGMRETCAGILRHVRGGSAIVVHGDYDADGVCSTAILVRALRTLGGDARWHLPDRSDDGYGLSLGTVRSLATAGAGLLITADCGITCADEVDEALKLGLDVVVTDHHRPAERLPDCPIVHPELSGYPFPSLCASGVAHKLAEALYATADLDPRLADEDVDLAALATVADLVPLVGENRRLVREGVAALARRPRPGLRALMGVAALEPGGVDSQALAFRLAPRLNAAGRMQRADAALELLLTDDEERAGEIAEELDQLNRERRDAETRILFAAEAGWPEYAHAAATVLAGEDWHPGVIGIVASRMVERHHRPCVLIALDGEGRGKGSGRSIPAYDLHAGLAACGDRLHRFGGHRVAAGLELDAEQVPAFRRDFQRHAAAALSPEDLKPSLAVDAVVPAGSLGLGLSEELRALGPFGAGNREPTLLVPAARVADARSMGDEAQHARFTLAGGGSRASGVAFRTTAAALTKLDGPHDVAVRLELNEWKGVVEPRLVLEGLAQPRAASLEEVGAQDGFWRALTRALDELPALEPAPTGAPSVRELRDRRGRGVAGNAGDLLSSGERVLLVCADVPRRRAALERLVAGLGGREGSSGGGDPVGACSWPTLAADTAVALPFDHLVAIDPPRDPGHLALLECTEGPASGGFVHLAWGAPEAEFALALARFELDLRAPLAALYRALREGVGAGATEGEGEGATEGEALERLLRGGGTHPRSAEGCALLLRVLAELELVELEVGLAGGSCRVLAAAGRTQLERSPTYIAAREALTGAERYLVAEGAAAPARAA